MTVIKPEMLTGEITKYDLLPLSFLKKSPYTGSKRTLRYRIEKTEVTVPSAEPSEGENAEEAAPARTVLRVYTWTGPYAFDLTPAEEKSQADFDFSDEGLNEIIPYLNRCLKETENS